MKDSCKHEHKITFNDIISNQGICDKKFICLRCNKKIKINVKKRLVFFISMIFIIIATCINIFSMNFLKEQLSGVNVVILYGYNVLILIGIIQLTIWILNGIFAIISKKAGYREVEEWE